MQELIGLLRQYADAREPCAVATVIGVRGSASARPGSKALIDRNRKVLSGWVGGGCAQSTVCQTALDCVQHGRTQIVDLNLDDEVLGTGMPCGGSMRVFVEPVLPKPVLWLLGHGAIAEALCRMGAALGFQVHVDDPMVERERYPAAARLMPADLDYSQLTPDMDDYVVLATQHKGDHQSMLRVVRSRCRYLALIASAKRARLVLDFSAPRVSTRRRSARSMRRPASISVLPPRMRSRYRRCRWPPESVRGSLSRISVSVRICVVRCTGSTASRRHSMRRLAKPPSTDIWNHSGAGA